MNKIRLNLDALAVETFSTTGDDDAARGTVHGHLSARYELCHADDTWQQSCTCEATCNAATCWNCGGSAGCPAPSAACSVGCTVFVRKSVDFTYCDVDCPPE